jgi:hypothetical protein
MCSIMYKRWTAIITVCRPEFFLDTKNSADPHKGFLQYLILFGSGLRID